MGTGIRPRDRLRARGFTLFELLIVMTVAGILLGIAVPAARAGIDRAVVRSAATDVRATLGMARSLALTGHTVVTVHIDSARGTLILRRGADVLHRRAVEQTHGVQLRPTRDSLVYDPFGLGHGVSNLSVVVHKGAAVETIFVSRMGRIR